MSPILIAHRGNTQGPNPEKENQPEYILQAIREGFDVEIDVWMFTHIPLDDQKVGDYNGWNRSKSPDQKVGDYKGWNRSKSPDRKVEDQRKSKEIWLGHDAPQYPTSLEFLTTNQDKLWCHAKNFHALTFLIKHGLHTFSHDNDPHVLTSRGVIWAYVGKEIDQNTICVMPERAPKKTYTKEQLERAMGICTDFCVK